MQINCPNVYVCWRIAETHCLVAPSVSPWGLLVIRLRNHQWHHSMLKRSWRGNGEKAKFWWTLKRQKVWPTWLDNLKKSRNMSRCTQILLVFKIGNQIKPIVITTHPTPPNQGSFFGENCASQAFLAIIILPSSKVRHKRHCADRLKPQTPKALSGNPN